MVFSMGYRNWFELDDRSSDIIKSRRKFIFTLWRYDMEGGAGAHSELLDCWKQYHRLL